MVVSDAADLNLNETFKVGGGSGSGTLVVDGSVTGGGDDIVNSRGGNDRFQLLDNGTLRFVIDQDAVDDPSNMRQIQMTSGHNSSSNVLFESGSLLDLQFDSAATPTAGSWTVMTTVKGITDNGLALAPTTQQGIDGITPGWLWNIEGNDLTITYVIPEPASLALLALGSTLLMRRRA